MNESSGTGSVTCPACGVRSPGRFCASCGAPLRAASCTECGTRLVVGARYCHACGTVIGAKSLARSPSPTPTARHLLRPAARRPLAWSIAAVALVAFTVFALAWSWGSSRNRGGAAVPADGTSGGSAAAQPSDIASMTPRERAERLYDRTMIAKEAAKLDSARFFASMAIQAYEALPDRTLDDRYDLGRLALVAGMVPRARAEADTILSVRPTHLLGLLLSEDAARTAGDEAAAVAAHRKLISLASAERQAGLPEYASHATELTAALARPAPTVPPPAPR